MRFMAIKDKRQARKARNIGVLWTIIAYIGALSIGWLGIAMFGPESIADREQVMPMVILELFPPTIAAILITGAIAAMISTADSLLILSATELSENLIKPGFFKRKDDRKVSTLMVSRIITLLLAIIALSLAYVTRNNMIFDNVSYVWAGIGGTFSVVILLTLFWKKYHALAVLLTIISGVLFTVLWIATGMEEKVSSRMLTFIVALFVAVSTTYIFHGKK